MFDIKKKNSSCKFFPIFGHQNPGSGAGSGYPDPYQINIGTDPKPWF